MRVCILETDTYADLPLDDHQSISEMFRTWLSPSLPEAEWTSIAVHSGERLPAPDDFAGYLITGSRHGVYDELPWMPPLTEFICQLRVSKTPVAGICFGHQIMAHAYGARVEKSEAGWVLGAETYGDLTAFAMHQDQVVETPSGAAKIIASPRCAIAKIEYDFPALSVQYHPEFSREFMERLLDLYETGEIHPELVDETQATLRNQTHVEHIADEFARFFRCHQTNPDDPIA